MKQICCLLFTVCIVFPSETQTATETNQYEFTKILTGTWRASNTKCLIEYTFTKNLKFTFFNTCAHNEQTTGAAAIINNNSFLLKHGKNIIFKAVYNGRYFVIKYNKDTEYMFKKWK